MKACLPIFIGKPLGRPKKITDENRDLHPSFIVLPFAILFALLVAVTASSFKKYL